MAETEGPIRLCYEGAVTRLAGELGQREVLQAGIELIDAPEPDSDAEVLAVAAAALAATRLPEARLDIGHVAPARHVLGAVHGDHGAAGCGAAGRGAAGRGAAGRGAGRRAAGALVTLWGPAEATLARAAQLAWPDSVRAALDRLQRVLAAFARLADPPAPAVTIDLGDLRGFDYYTGVRFAGYAGGAPDAVLRGGRYDELIARYGRDAHATVRDRSRGVSEAQRAAGVPAPARTASRWQRAAAAVAARAGCARSPRSRGPRRRGCAAPGSTPRW
jgi:ATP phosphoribosyltransferase regulatory subunit